MKVDKSTMHASLEARVPFLDQRVVEFAFRLPPEWKVRFFKGKWILRKLAEKYLPRRIAWRRKHGLWAPWEEWIRDSSNEMMRELFRGSVVNPGILDLHQIQRDFESLQKGEGGVDTGLFFRLAILGLWLSSLQQEKVETCAR